jgi:hypothetical protein
MIADPVAIRHVVRFLRENSAPDFADHVTEMAEEITRLRDALTRLACAGEEATREFESVGAESYANLTRTTAQAARAALDGGA